MCDKYIYIYIWYTSIVVAHNILFNTATHRVSGLEYRYIEYCGNTYNAAQLQVYKWVRATCVTHKVTHEYHTQACVRDMRVPISLLVSPNSRVLNTRMLAFSREYSWSKWVCHIIETSFPRQWTDASTIMDHGRTQRVCTNSPFSGTKWKLALKVGCYFIYTC